MAEKTLLELIKSNRSYRSKAINSMGCSEDWYNPYFCVANVFTDDELDCMTGYQLESLVRLAETIGEALY